MATLPADINESSEVEDHPLVLRREGATMALYVAICLLAALSLLRHDQVDHRSTVLEVVWGTTLGLALAHWFAFQMSARLVAGGTLRRTDGAVALAQLIGAAAVAVLASVPLIVFDGSASLAAASFAVAGFIGVIGFTVARSGGSTKVRATVFGSITLLVAAVIAVVKNVLMGH